MMFFIFTSQADLPHARRLAESVRKMPADACVVRDAADAAGPSLAGEMVTNFPRNGRLRGSECVAGMLDVMHVHCRGHRVVAKLDADCRLDITGLCWLLAARDGEARGFRIGRHDWSGIWSVETHELASIRRAMRCHRCLFCPEASIVRRVFSARLRVATHPQPAVSWLPGTEFPRAPLVTLPSRLRGSERSAAIDALMSAR
ncbi:MAG: hypothetical protein H7A48_14490 [Akkermansiaceae bacterium]|nr:hypothetical protein [Akkermansiaceae bacterium]MCP5549226.1 hypothetical protein [Akkermansiaceae bacterium]